MYRTTIRHSWWRVNTLHKGYAVNSHTHTYNRCVEAFSGPSRGSLCAFLYWNSLLLGLTHMHRNFCFVLFLFRVLGVCVKCLAVCFGRFDSIVDAFRICAGGSEMTIFDNRTICFGFVHQWKSRRSHSYAAAVTTHAHHRCISSMYLCLENSYTNFIICIGFNTVSSCVADVVVVDFKFLVYYFQLNSLLGGFDCFFFFRLGESDQRFSRIFFLKSYQLIDSKRLSNKFSPIRRKFNQPRLAHDWVEHFFNF